MDDQQLRIRLAEDRCPTADSEQPGSDAASQPLVVKAALVRCCSTVAEGLPAEAAEWDLSNLLIDGQPVQRSTVIRWLNHWYMRVHNIMFDKHLPYDEVLSAAALFQLLAFADSVGSGRGIIMACLSEKQLQQMYMRIKRDDGLQEPGQPQQQQQQQQQQEPKTAALHMDNTSYGFAPPLVCWMLLATVKQQPGVRGYAASCSGRCWAGQRRC
ncbi:hypothetical protein OEZ85_003579 [Tetradesmus obliquus]|uniref:Uncharacterized protein n=1 Tax=Tetradesmus obliquus TaxID=3088 RepID=A0ABY8UBR4_TETOB|nr:hypothetical protein OEZ85_003579 [Tetradesmus obliquus]